MKIFFAGTPEVAASVLERLLEAGIEVAGVLSKEDARVGRKQVITPSAVSSLAISKGLPLVRSNRFTEQVREFIRGTDAKLGVVVAHGSILKSPDLESLPLGWINLHFSLLPQYPGPAPVQHSLLSGDIKTGVTVFKLDEGVDSGPIISQAELPILEVDNTKTLMEKLAELGSGLLVQTIINAPSSLDQAKNQARASAISPAFKPTRNLARLDFRNTAERAFNVIRAMFPEPTAYCLNKDQELKVIEAMRVPSISLDPGECRLIENKVVVGFSDGSLSLEVVQPAGKKVMSGADWFRGLRQGEVILS